MKMTNSGNRGSESGNVLFLILIAVALFAALSFAVTQSTRGGGDARSETTALNSAQMTQYPAGVRTSIMRMAIRGIDGSEMLFNTPSQFGEASFVDKLGVFHANGGNASYAPAPIDLMDATGNNPDGIWYFNGEFEIESIGTSGAGGDGNEIIAFLPGIKEGVCYGVNEKFGIKDLSSTDNPKPIVIPVTNTDFSGYGTTGYRAIMATGADEAAAQVSGFTSNFRLGDSATGTEDLEAQPFGCFRNQVTGEYVYYHVLMER